MKKTLIPVLAVCLLTACRTPKSPTTAVEQQSSVSTIAFGSCDDHKRPQVLWDDIVAQKPEVWIWLGDNVYGDTQNMDTLRNKYNIQKANPNYQQLRQSARVIGVWDDHDYGVNDGGKEYPRKTESQQVLLDFLDVPANSPLRTQKGAYSSHVFGPKGQRVKVILLDGRYFRDPLKKENKVNTPDPTGDILGETQWQWLEKQLTRSDADIHLIGCGIQFLANDHKSEKWGNFPTARQRFLDLIAKTKPKGAILMSGDRHIAEVSKVSVPGLGYDLYDITSSGISHTTAKRPDELNKLRVGNVVYDLNYALISIDWNRKPLTATVRINGDNQQTYLTQEIQFR